MGLIDLYKSKYEFNHKEQQGEWVCIWNGLVASKTFLSNLVFKRANKSFECIICKKEKPKGTRYLGDGWKRVCCDCSLEWIENSKKELQKMDNLLNKAKDSFKLNEIKWRKEMLIGALE